MSRQPNGRFDTGNQIAKGHGFGRPKEHDRQALAQDIVEWVKDEDHWILKEWRIKHFLSYDAVMHLCKDPVFSDAYDYANAVISARREKMAALDELKEGIYRMNVRVYDRELHENMKGIAEHEANCKAAATKALETNSGPVEVHVTNYNQ